MKGKIVLFIGPMWASKTSALISYVKKLEIAKKKFIVVKYGKDDRYSANDIVSHDMKKYSSTYTTNSLSHIAVEDDVFAVLIDEGQFFPDLVEVCDSLASKGKIVVVAGLDGDFKREPFPSITNLIPKAEEIHKLHAICVKCGEDASFSRRIISSNEYILIGGSESYEPRCRECFEL